MLNIKIDGYAQDETELIMTTLHTLLLQLEVKDLSVQEFERFENEIKKIMLCIAAVYGRSGKNESLPEDEKVFNEEEGQLEALNKGKITILESLLESLKYEQFVL